MAPKPEEHYVSCVPLVPLEAAAGGFGPNQVMEEEWQWVRLEGHRPRPGMFVARVVGRSMEPRIHDGAYCLFRAPVVGSRQHKIVLVQLLGGVDPEKSERYTVKRYESEKARDGASWQHQPITLKPLNPDYQAITILGNEGDVLTVVAELVDVLDWEEA